MGPIDAAREFRTQGLPANKKQRLGEQNMGSRPAISGGPRKPVRNEFCQVARV